MTELVFATNNPHKLQEIRAAVGKVFVIRSLKDIGCQKDIPETAQTIEENASQKSRFIYQNYGFNCFADDTGLEVEALDGRPGVYSARFAGPEQNHEKNIDKLLEELKDEQNRKARFRTVISLVLNGQEYFFEGTVNGVILSERHGRKGFGYDPIFQPEGYNKTFAEMELTQKNRISHRGKAIRELVAFLQNL